MSYKQTAKSTPIQTGALPATWPPLLTAKTGYTSTPTFAQSASATTSPVTIPEDLHGKTAHDLRLMVAKLRTQNEHLRQAYEIKANKEKDKVVDLERQHFQKQIDDYKAYANGEIAKAWQEADHWREQVKIIYSLLEEQTQLAEQAIAERDELGKRLEEQEPKVKAKHIKKASGKLKRLLEEE